MLEYFNNKLNPSDDAITDLYDNIPLWSAPFGFKLMEMVEMLPKARALDVGCATGFPLIELAERLGADASVYGIDLWAKATEQALLKSKTYSLKNVTIVNASAEKMPFDDNYFDIIVSNNGLNNVANQAKAIFECYRVARKGCQMVLTMNLPDTMIEFYSVYEDILRDLGNLKEIDKLHEHIDQKRKPKEYTAELLHKYGFRVKEIVEDSFKWRFATGSAFLNYSFIRLAFLESWTKLLIPDEMENVFTFIEAKLNQIAAKNNGFVVTVPYIAVDARKD